MQVHPGEVFWGFTGPVDEVRVSPDGALLVAADDHSVRLWEIGQQTPRWVVEVPASNLAFSPDSRVVGFTTIGDVVQLRSDTGKLMSESPRHQQQATSLAFSPDGRFIVTGDGQGYVHFWDATTWRPLFSFLASPHRSEQAPLARSADLLTFRSDGACLAVFSADTRGCVQVWDIDPTGAHIAWITAIIEPDHAAFEMRFSPDGHYLAVADYVGEVVRLFDAQTLVEVAKLGIVGEISKGLAFSPDSRWLAVAGGAGMVWIWDLVSQRVSVEFAAHTEGCDYRTNSELWAIGEIDWSPTKWLLATSGTSPFTHYDTKVDRFTGPADYTVKLWNVHAE